VPTPEDVQRIAALQDPVIRNLQITQCYHELSAAFAAHTGPSANWCTFATWASRQAGQTIRQEDLARLLERRLKQALSAREAAQQAAAAGGAPGNVMATPEERVLDPRRYTTALERASDAVGRGNKKVFEEIGFEFARFLESCLQEGPPDDEAVARFRAGLKTGGPPDGQGSLRRAFTHYAAALRTADAGKRAQWILLANIEIGFHEQTRLQPEIAESVDAGYLNSVRLSREILAVLVPSSSWLAVAYMQLRRLLGRPTRLDMAVSRLKATMQSYLRQRLTEVMMTLALPSGVQLGLGADLQAGFPQSLRQIANEELQQLLARYDPTPDSPLASGALDWADLPDRLHFIIDLFRTYQENAELLAPPFTAAQVAALREGRRPAGRL
jgi:hypothetical protein